MSWKTWVVPFIAALLLGAAAAANSPQNLLAAGRVDDAITALQSQITASPDSAESYNLLCRAYFSLGDWDRAVSACEKAVKLDGNNSEYHLWLGRAYGEKADRVNFLSAASLAKKLRHEFEQAVALDPKSVDAHTDLAEFYLEAPGIVGGGQDKAREQARILNTLNPAKAHWVYARIAEKRKDGVTAEHEYRAEIDADQGSADSWLELSYFFKRAGRLDDMQSAIQKASTSHVNRSYVLVDGAETLIKADRDLPLAKQLLLRYLEMGSVEQAPSFKAHYLLGTLLEKQGDRAGAAQEYRTSLALARNFGRAQEALNRVTQ
ncbi:MAG TPA: tetratricopeptide repeat protein [Terriglobales bacterium]|nr:tetratricopeptide repeat protein [Terriglobales bacterium]